MEFMVCLNGETDQHPYLFEIANLGAGIELGGYGLSGVRSQNEIHRWEKAGIEIVLENDVEKSPDLLINLVKTVNSPSLQLCLDVGHLHYLSPYSSIDWVNKMGSYLKHIHIHDNDQKADHHWTIGKGTFNFEAFCSSIENNSSNITLSIEVEGTMEEKMNDLRKIINRFKK